MSDDFKNKHCSCFVLNFSGNHIIFIHIKVKIQTAQQTRITASVLIYINNHNYEASSATDPEHLRVIY